MTFEVLLNLCIEYGALLVIASLAGIFNAISALSMLFEQTQRTPIFRPYTNWLFWVWVLAEIFIPAIGFWWVFNIERKTLIDIGLCVKSIGFGLSFTAVATTSLTTGPVAYSIKPLYELLISITRVNIAKKDRNLNLAFWNDFSDELATIQENNITVGLDFVVAYFKDNLEYERSPHKTQEIKNLEIENLEKKVEIARNPDTERISKIISVVKSNIHRDSLYTCLSKFNCTKTQNKYLKYLKRGSTSAF